MERKRYGEALILGISICVGLALLGHFIAGGVVKFRALDRTVTAKGLSEREVAADVAIWPIRFDLADNDLAVLSTEMEKKSGQVLAFLRENGFNDDEITVGTPAVVDRRAQRFGGPQDGFRYQGSSTITVYSGNIEGVRAAMTRLVDLGKQGVAVGSGDYDTRPQFLFTRLNDFKPDMIEEATRNARQVAEKFARDSDSNLGKIRKARQGQFSINDRDSNTPHIKKIRVVATLEYFLTD
ncbi:MAG: SIMPL domain-containing protein [Candidatus Krumholzibacteriota bacterium]